MSESKNISNCKNANLMRSAVWAAFFVTIALIVMKFWAYNTTSSLSIFSSMVDSMLDGITAIINIVVVKYSLKPPDEKHKFGHGKAEDIAGLAQSALIGFSAFFIVSKAIVRLMNPVPLENSASGIAVMAGSILMVGMLILLQRYVVKKTKSSIIKADNLNYTADLLVNIATIISIAISSYGFYYADPIFAILIAGYMLFGAWKIGVFSFQRLVDGEIPEKQNKKIVSIVLSNEGVKGIHDLKTRRSGLIDFIQFHLEMDGNLTLNEAHDISDTVEQSLKKDFPSSDIVIHEDPA